MGSHMTVNGLKLWVQDSGPETATKGTVLLFHGFPDTSDMWQPQIKALNAAGYRTIAPDLPGLGQSDKPADPAAYSFQTAVTPAMVELVNSLKLDKFSVVGHDFGAGLAWGLGFMCPDKVERVVVLSVGYMGTYFTAQPLEQRAASWYMPLFLLPGSEDAVKANDWALLRLWLGKDGASEQVDAWIERLAQPGALTAALNLYRGNFSVELFGNLTPVPPPFKLPMPVLGVHPKDDWGCLEGQMKASEIAVQEGKWTFKQIPGGHWFFVQEPDTLNKLLLEFLA